jgi:hypothetical protein
MGGGEALGRILVVFNGCCLEDVIFLLVCGVVWREVVRGVLKEVFKKKVERESKEENGCTLEVLKGKMWLLSVKIYTICSSYFFLLFFVN